MSGELDRIVSAVAEETFGALAFMFSMPEDDGGGGAMAWVSVEFEGPFSGHLAVGVSREALPALAGNMLGLEDAASATVDQQYDGLKELANVVCGNLLPRIAGKRALFEIDTPEMIAGSPSRGGGTAAGEASMTLEEGEAQILLFFDGPGPSVVE